MLAAAAIAATFTTKIVERIKDQFGLQGTYVALVAYATGVVIAFGFNLAAFNDLLGASGVQPELWVDKLFTGISIGAGAGFLSDIAGR